MIRIIPILILAQFFLRPPAIAQGWYWGRGSIGNNVSSWPVATDSSGNAYVAGESSGTLSFDNYAPSFASNNNLCVVAKYDPFGDFLWARNTENGADGFTISITTDFNGNCYLLGWMPGPTIGIGTFILHNTVYPNAQYFIAKYSPDGDVLWAMCAGGRSGGYGGIPSVVFDTMDTAKIAGLGAISTDQSGNIYVTTDFNLPTVTAGSYTLTNTDATGATDDIMLVKYSSAGNVIWATSTGGSREDIACGITVTPAGAIYIAGFFNSDSIVLGTSVIKDTSTATQNWNGFIARYNTSGNAVWGNGSGGTGMVYAAGVAADANNNVYLTGGTAESSIWFGDVNIVDPYPGKALQYIVCFNSSNDVFWYKTIGSLTGGIAWGYGVSVSPGGNVWVCGSFSDEVNIAGHILDPPIASIDPVFIACFDTLGNYIASGALQSGGSKQAGIAADVWGDAYLCSDYEYPCFPFIIANDVLANATTDESWLYLAKYVFPGSIGPGSGDGPCIAYIRNDTSMCPDDTLYITAPPGYAAYRWNNGTTDTALQITDAGTYQVTCTGNLGCMLVDTFEVSINSALCNCKALMPNAFTPNGDGRDDTYGPVFESGCSITHYAFSIYNRWGQCVYYTENPYAQWDGTFNGASADQDVYMFYLVYSTNPNYPEHKKKGDVTLIR